MSLEYLDTGSARYILDTAEGIDRRLSNEAEHGWECDPRELRQEVAWLARAVSRLAEDAGAHAADRRARARDTLTGSSDTDREDRP